MFAYARRKAYLCICIRVCDPRSQRSNTINKKSNINIIINCMKRKFTLLLVALATIVSSSMLVSCKDTTDDLENDLRLQMLNDKASLEEALELQRQNLETMIGQYKAQLDAIKSCTCDSAAMQQTITGLQQTISGLADQLSALNLSNKSDSTAIVTITQTLDTLTQTYTNISSNYSALSTTVGEMNTAQTLMQAAIDSLQNALTSACECTPYDDSAILARIDTLEQAMIQASALAQTANSKATVADSIARQALVLAQSAQAAANAAQTAADSAKVLAQKGITDAATAQATANAAQTAANAAQSVANTALANAATNATNIAKLEQRVDSCAAVMLTQGNTIALNTTRIEKLETRIVLMSDSLKTAYERSAYAAALALADSIEISLLKSTVTANTSAIAANKNSIDSLITVVTTLEGTVGGHTALIDSLKSVTNTLDGKITTLDTKVDNVKEELNQTLTQKIAETKQYADSLLNVAKAYTDQQIDSLASTVDSKVGAVKDSLNALQQSMQQQIDDLNDAIDDINDKLSEIEDTLDEIKGDIEEIQEALAKQVTSIIIQGTHNPAFGSINVPASVNTNILIAYFGTALGDVTFPTTMTGNYAYPELALTNKEMQMLGSVNPYTAWNNDTLVSDKDNNAGTLYLTINPNSADLTGLKVNLENSQGRASGVKLGALKPSDEKLTFGYTRATSNGFYEAPAKVTDVSRVQKVDFKAEKIASAVKEIIKKRQNADFPGIASDLYTVLQGVSLDANAVKAGWSDAYGDHAVYSQYAIAATAIKPLSLTSLDYDKVTVPGYERAMAFIDRMYNKVVGMDVYKEGLVKLTKAQYVSVDVVKGTASITLTLANVDRDGNVVSDMVEPKTVVIEVGLAELNYAIFGTIDYVATGLTQNIQQIVDFLNDLLNLSLDMLDTATNKAKNALERANRLIVKVVNNINERLQPVLVYETPTSAGIISASRYNPTQVAANFELIPTTWNFELAVPLFKKHVAVVDVFKGSKSAQAGDADCLAKLQAANATMNEVFDGNTRRVNTSKMVSGYTYKIAYSALDYHGKIGIYRGYVTIK